MPKKPDSQASGAIYLRGLLEDPGFRSVALKSVYEPEGFCRRNGYAHCFPVRKLDYGRRGKLPDSIRSERMRRAENRVRVHLGHVERQRPQRVSEILNLSCYAARKIDTSFVVRVEETATRARRTVPVVLRSC